MKTLRASPTISTAYLAAMLDAMDIAPARARGFLREAGIAPALIQQPSARITEDQFATLYRLLAVQLDDEMPRLFSRPLRPGSLKFTCSSLLDAQNLQVALHRWALVLRLLQDDVTLDIQVGESFSRIALLAVPGCAAVKPLALDLMLKLVHGVASWLVGRQIPLIRVHFSFPSPPYAADYHNLYPGPAHFGQAETALHVETAHLRLPIRRTRPEMTRFLRRAPQDWVFVSFEEQWLGQRLREHLAGELPGPATAEGAAQALHVSPRTLHRRLQAEGTSFQRIKDELRRDAAVQRLTQTRAPIAAIAADLGFDSTASFHRAFRAWTGDTPGTYRGPRRT